MKKNKGQIAVFVLLLLLLGLTVGLSVTSRTLQDLKQSAVTDQSSRAFTAAEAGIEKALTNLAAGTSGPVNVGGTTVNYSVTPVTSGFNSSSPISRNDVISINLSNSGTDYDGSLSIYWQKPDEQQAALVLSFYGVDNNNGYFVKKYAYNPNGCSLSDCNQNNFASSGSGNGAYLSMINIAVPAYSKILRLGPVYNDASISVVPSNPVLFPPQGYTIKSTGQTSAGVSRAVQVDRTSSGLAPIFDYVLFSSSNISQ